MLFTCRKKVKNSLYDKNKASFEEEGGFSNEEMKKYKRKYFEIYQEFLN